MFGPYLDAQPPTVATWQSLYNIYNFFGIVAAILVISYFVFTMVKFRKKGDHAHVEHQEEKGVNWRKVLFTLAITSSVLFIAEYQTFNSVSLFVPPQSADALHIGVIGQQWSWTFVYPNGARTGNLTVPVGREVILNVTSIDVAHSFTINGMDIGIDAIPGRSNTAWFTSPTNPSVYTIRCKELCGVGHAFMFTKLVVIGQAAYDTWYASLGAK